MFYYISGKLALATPTTAVIDAGGVGYQMTISQNTFSNLPHRSGNGELPIAKLYTHMAVREDGIELFGFFTETELSTFRMLLTVSGVGPKVAISILSLLTPEKFAIAVCTEDRKIISKANGVGAKTAARIILELKDKLQKEMSAEDIAIPQEITQLAVPARGKLTEATDALLVLGYTRAQALNVLKSINAEELSVEDIIKSALKKLM